MINHSLFLIDLDPDERLAQNIDGCSRKSRNQGRKALLRLQYVSLVLSGRPAG